ncbi:hypothetical protein C4N15_05025 [Fusobacterium necrophorum subsp. funduliforme]|uniref:hypothetical protein n=1 Tax=Fusobacterium necrophorum TaxID=859 RepID=UPI000D1247A8|nr:hypothetical protein [Fusobacterium necrophorum]AVQ21038.1 hypothetical protein C4N15_05025 [Fusobacterium necrophorum subsp. funduliforme]
MILAFLISLGFFFLSLSFPLIAFALPTYQIKNLAKWGLQRSILLHLVILILLWLFQKELCLVYFVLPFSISLWYFFFLYLLGKEERDMNQIVITALSSTAMLGLYWNFFHKQYQKEYELVLGIYQKAYQLTQAEIQGIHEYIAGYFPSMIFQYMMLTVFFCYLALVGMKKYREWSLHYVWTVPYIVYSLMINVFRIENIYIHNFGEMAKAILLWYGIKSIYDLLADYFKRFAWILHGASFLLAIEFPNAVFIFGGIILLLEHYSRKKIGDFGKK